MNLQMINDVSKEVITLMQYIQKDEFKEKIPDTVIKKLEKLAEKSNKVVNIDINKDLKDQDVSEECKDLIAILYYRFIANKIEKRRILSLWNENERKYQQDLMKKYNLNNDIFKIKHNEEENINILPVEIKKVNLIDKIINFINRVFHKE